MRKIQIGVMGSTEDLRYTNEVEEIAKKLGKLIAESGNILVYGAEKDSNSLSNNAAKEAKKYNGLTVGITYGRGKDIYEKDNAEVIISSGLERGGGREFVLVNSCDVIIIIGGGSGTLNETAIAYQLNIPIIAIEGTNGWSDKLIDTYLDDRKRLKIQRAKTPEEAVKLATNMS